MTVSQTTLTLFGSISASLSCFGALMVAFSYILFPKLRRPARELLLYLSICDMITSIIYLVEIRECTSPFTLKDFIQVLVSVYFPVASFVWTGLSCLAQSRVI